MRPLTALAILLGLWSSVSFAIAAETPKVFNIEQQPLATALNQFAQQSDRQILFSTEVVNAKRTSGIRGELEPEVALRKLLKGTGLSFRVTADNTILVDKPGDTANVPVPQNSIRLAQVGGSETSSRSEEENKDPSSRDNEKKLIELEEILVTGSRLKRDANDGPSPVVVFDREAIDRLGVTSVSDVLEYLPQQTFSAEEGFNFGGSRSVQLRGLGHGTTLILIDGRRTVTSALNGARNFFDMNSIPLAAVERVEILSDSASAVYGTDAVGGVVNIILKKDITAPVAELYYGAADGGADERRASLSYGHATDRWKGSVVFDYFDRDFLLGEERDFYSNADYRRFGGTDRRVATSNPANICSADGSNLTGLTTSCAAVPVGSTGIGLTPANFLATAGQTYLQTTSTYNNIITAAERRSVFATGELGVTEQMTAFAELFFTNREEIRRGAPLTLNNTLVPANNPFNPFGEAVRIRYLIEGLGPQSMFSQMDFWRAASGLKGAIGSWDWEVSGLITDESGTDFRSYVLDNARVTAALNSTNPATALNVFQDGPGGSPELLAQLAVVDPLPSKYGSRAVQGSAFARGSVANLPAGSLETVVGVEAREEQIAFNTSSIVLKTDRRSSSAFAELRAPLIGEAMDVSLVRRLDLTLAARYDDYDDFGSTVNPQYGIEWSPVSQLLLRASYGTSFRAPSIFELHQPPASFSGGQIFDPRRNENATNIVTVTGGNDQLVPEESDSLTIGFVFTPSGPESNLRVRASYWRIEQDQRVQRLQNQTLIVNESLFPDRIVRDPPTAQDIAAGRPGVVRQLISTSMNFGSLETDGVDFEISDAFDMPVGRFRPSLAATWIDDFIAADFPNAPALDRVGIANIVQGSVVKWKGVATLAWDYQGFGVTTTARYTSSYQDANQLGTPVNRMLPSQTLMDLQASMDFGRNLGTQSGLFSGLVLRGGVINLFDKGPTFSDSGGRGFDTYHSDIRGRFGYLSLSKTF